MTKTTFENCRAGPIYEIHVWPQGCAEHSDRIEAALKAARSLQARVVLQLGKYSLSRTLQLGNEDVLGAVIDPVEDKQ